ncbi:MAG: IscS subfamily cysteine desulfurase [Planctomycetales bacterium]|nr:IscS subfamily cysteine desulfurase [Planctomycetales bacterium]
MPRIYLDHNATTPVDPRVLEAMLPFFREKFGNAASKSHSFGWEAEDAVEAARAQVAALIGAEPKEVVFTSGATEADNLAIKGVCEAYAENGNHVVTGAMEHNAVLDTCRALGRRGVEVTVLPVGRDGIVDPDAVARAIGPRTVLVSIMAANNEIGTLQPVAEIGRIAKERGVLFHSDAAQAAGKVPLDVGAAGVDLLSISAHKIYGPKGVGALYVRRRDPRVKLAAQVDGGGHERGLRSGTLPVPLIVGFGKACEFAGSELREEAARLRRLRDRLHRGIVSRLDGVTLNGHVEKRLPGTLSLAFAGVEGEGVMMGMKDVAVSSGAACTSASIEPSHVLLALGIGEDAARSSLRFGLGRSTTEAEVDAAIEAVVASVTRLREASKPPRTRPKPTEAVS